MTNEPTQLSLACELFNAYKASVGEIEYTWEELKADADDDHDSIEAGIVTAWGKVACRAYELLTRKE